MIICHTSRTALSRRLCKRYISNLVIILRSKLILVSVTCTNRIQGSRPNQINIKLHRMKLDLVESLRKIFKFLTSQRSLPLRLSKSFSTLLKVTGENCRNSFNNISSLTLPMALSATSLIQAASQILKIHSQVAMILLSS